MPVTSSEYRVKKEASPNSDDEIIYCSICANPIMDYIPDYFCGETINPACRKCKRYESILDDDPLSSFPDYGVPCSLISHWTPAHTVSSPSLLDLQTMRAHYVRLPNPGSRFLSMKEVLQEFKVLMEDWMSSGRK